MRTLLIILSLSLFSLLAKGQNKWGFETAVNTLLKGSVDTIHSEALLEMVQNERVMLLDTRQKVEFEVSHLPGARHVGYDDFSLSAVKDIPKSTTVVVYCSVGKRSEDVGAQLKAAGYRHVFNHWGGIFDWTNRGMEVVDMDNRPVKRVHPYNELWGIWVNNYEKSYEPR